jgi:hypothetical protein
MGKLYLRNGKYVPSCLWLSIHINNLEFSVEDLCILVLFNHLFILVIDNVYLFYIVDYSPKLVELFDY